MKPVIIIAIAVVLLIPIPVFGQSSIVVTTDKASYLEDETILITGEVSQLLEEYSLSLTVIAPNGELVLIDQLTVGADKKFSTSLASGGNLMKDEGTYTVTVQYGSNKYNSAETTFQYEGTIFTTQPFITISTDKSTYQENEMMKVWYYISEKIPNEDFTITLYGPNDEFIGSTGFSQYYLVVGDNDRYTTFFPYDRELDDGIWYLGGVYTLVGEYANSKTSLTVEVITSPDGSTIQQPTPVPFDDVAPLILTPSDLTVDTTYSSVLVDFMVKAIDNRDGILRPNCFPSSGSLFSVGETTVTCSAIDSSGNSDRKSFTITVRASDVTIPSWIRGVASFWCDDEIDDNSFIEAIQYLVTNNVIVVPATAPSSSDAQEIPSWIKSNACWWSQELISDKEFTSGLQYLIEQGIIRVILTSEPSQSSFETAVLSDQNVKPYEITIVGDGTCKYKTNQALDLLRNNAGIHYEVVTYHVGVIECVDKGSGIAVWAAPPRFSVGEKTIDAGTIWYAGSIVHESCHSKLYSDYLKNNPQTGLPSLGKTNFGFVPSNIYSGKDAEAQCVTVQYHALVLLGATQSTLDFVENAIESEYWNIPYEDRWW